MTRIIDKATEEMYVHSIMKGIYASVIILAFLHLGIVHDTRCNIILPLS